jgi:hypothetical protein
MTRNAKGRVIEQACELLSAAASNPVIVSEARIHFGLEATGAAARLAWSMLPFGVLSDDDYAEAEATLQDQLAAAGGKRT